MKVFNRIILFAACVGYIACQTGNELDLGDIGEKIPDFNNYLNKTNATLPNAEDVENVLREKCKKNGAEDAVDSLKAQQDDIKLCVEKYVNFTLVQEELENAKKTGSMDEVFGKYCKKWPSIYSCFDNITITARSCMDENEKKAFNKSLDILTELQEFMCFKDGDRLAMFVAEGGIECIQEQKEGIQNCVNATLGGRIPDPGDLSVATLPTFLFSPKDCEDFEKVRLCVNEELEKCQDSTPANIVDAFFKFMKKHMPCVNEEGYSDTRKAIVPAGSWAISSSLLLVVALCLGVKMY